MKYQQKNIIQKEINSEDLKKIFPHIIEERVNPWGSKEIVLTTNFKTK